MNAYDTAFDHSSFTRNRMRLLEEVVVGNFSAAGVDETRMQGVTSSEQLTIDGTLIGGDGIVQELPAQG